VTNVRIAMCQTLCIDNDREGNFVRIGHALSRAADLNAQIACFPETCILGWVNPESHQRAHPIPGSKPSHDVQRLCALARQHGLMLSVGLAEKDGEKLFDSAVLIDRDGTLLLKHRKRNILTYLMTPPYTPGTDIRVTESRYGRIGLLICADTFLSEYLQAMCHLHPDLVLVPFGWAAENDQWPEHGKELANVVAKAARAIGAPVVGVDLVGSITYGPWCGRTYGGQSSTSDAFGKILNVAQDRDSDVVIVELALPVNN
jgi:N-carbamoylputrescine amidase